MNTNDGPGPCGDPSCPVLHADPANPIHPPEHPHARIRQLEDAIRRHKEAVGSQDDLPAEVVSINRRLWSVIR